MNLQELHKLISEGENDKVEFKSSFNIEAIESLVAFANTGGGKVLIGIHKGTAVGIDLNTETVQTWVNEIKTKTSPMLIPDVDVIATGAKKVVVFIIQEYPVKPVSVRGKYYKRVANSNHLLSTSEVVNMHLQTFNTSWDYHLNNQFSIESISLEKVQLAIDTMNQAGGRTHDDPLTFLLKNDLVRESALTNAAYLLFAKSDSVLTTIELGRFQSDIIIKDAVRTKADILTQAEQVLDFVRKHINKEIIVTGNARHIERWQYPLEAIREIVLNMVVHRDYRSASDAIVKIYDHKIEFYNPGRLPDNITVEDLLTNNYKSTPRNKLIADFCKSLGIIEKYGSGIKRIIDYFAGARLPMPEFRNISDGFMVTVSDGYPETVEETVEKTVEETVEETVPRDKAVAVILDSMVNDPRITQAQLMEKTGLSRRGIEWHIARLKQKGMIKRIGATKNGYWEVKGG
ncbi:winged helix-turn-helix transcriptional regulator (plasmid) [Pedobacter sp. BS3]|uniref:ATP-binding protein n=1 Tax=Pedobacter sp. BS3 TaxID=2567937 RepID=UPI0011EE09B1|nr:ATP-binding protein [Pedobacter sp. BS3]TZF86443.1 winged helix-turn-helix transcriptional regulator [Pedobacter sp. BS3]